MKAAQRNNSKGVSQMVVAQTALDESYKSALSDFTQLLISKKIDEATYGCLCQYAKMVYNQQMMLNRLMTDSYVTKTTLQFMADDLVRYSTVCRANGLGSTINTNDRDTIIKAYQDESCIEVDKKIRLEKKQ